MLERNLAQVPIAERDRLIKTISENPEFFTKLAGLIQSKVDSGKDQMEAVKEVLEEYQGELSGLFNKR